MLIVDITHWIDKKGEIPNANPEFYALLVNDEVDVIGMPDEDECEHEMFVTMRWEKDGLAVPLSQLKPISYTDAETRQAVADWHYWVQRGYTF